MFHPRVQVTMHRLHFGTTYSVNYKLLQSNRFETVYGCFVEQTVFQLLVYGGFTIQKVCSLCVYYYESLRHRFAKVNKSSKE